MTVRKLAPVNRTLPRRQDRPLRIGVAFPGDARKANAWSGTPAGIMAGLERNGVQVVPLGARLPDRIDNKLLAALSAPHILPQLWRGRRSRADLAPGFALAANGMTHGATETAWLAFQQRSAGQLDGIVQISTSYQVRHPRVVTFEDMTVAQACALHYPEWERLNQISLRARLARQKRAYQRATACLGATPWVSESIVQDYQIAPAATAAVGLGANHVVTPPAGRDWSTPRFLFIGKDWERKNGPRLLNAFAQLRQEFPGARLDLVGRHPRVDADGVVGHGFLSLSDPQTAPALTALFQQATCLVVPSLVEPAGIVYLEAGAAGLPSIGTQCGGAAFMVGDGGLSVDPTDPAALVQAMLSLTNPQTAQAAGERAQRRARLFTWELVGSRILQQLHLQDWQATAWEGLWSGPTS